MPVLVALLPLVTFGFFGYLIHRGFRDGDQPGDVSVRVVSVRRSAGGDGCWIEVALENPGPSVALVAARPRFSGPLGYGNAGTLRRAGSRRTLGRVSEQMVGVLAPGDDSSLWVWSERAAGRSAVEVSVGTPGRLRYHRIGCGRALSAALAEPELSRHRGSSTTPVG